MRNPESDRGWCKRREHITRYNNDIAGAREIRASTYSRSGGCWWLLERMRQRQRLRRGGRKVAGSPRR